MERTQIIARLKVSKAQHDASMMKRGAAAGKKWAEGSATYAELNGLDVACNGEVRRLLSALEESDAPPCDTFYGWIAADSVVCDDCTADGADAFWESLKAGTQSRFAFAFVLGFAQAALTVWLDVVDDL